MLGRGGTTFWAERVGGPPLILTYDPLWFSLVKNVQMVGVSPIFRRKSRVA
jgi:hypothetical protein